MKDSRTEPVIPNIDRRQHKRYLTLKNFRNFMIVVIVLFALISIQSELRGTRIGGYGRIMERGLPTVAVQEKPVDVVPESNSIEDQRMADPMLVEPMAREQWLYGSDERVDALQTGVTQTHGTAPGRDARVAIVGGPEGVTVVREERRRPVLSGGFGR